MVSTLFRDPQALSSDLASLGTLQPRAFESLNRVETLDSASNYYLYDGREECTAFIAPKPEGACPRAECNKCRASRALPVIQRGRKEIKSEGAKSSLSMVLASRGHAPLENFYDFDLQRCNLSHSKSP